MAARHEVAPVSTSTSETSSSSTTSSSTTTPTTTTASTRTSTGAPATTSQPAEPPQDSVTVEDEDEDGRAGSGSIFDADGPGNSQPYQPGYTPLGTKKDPVVTTYREDGVRVREEQYLDESGDPTRRLSYRQDGAQVTETSTDLGQGNTRSVTEVSRDGRTERTVSNVTQLDGDIEEYVDDDHLSAPGDGQKPGYPRGLEGRGAFGGGAGVEIPYDDSQYGDRDGVVQTDTIRTVTNDRTGRTRTLDDSTTWQQTAQVSSAGPEIESAEHEFTVTETRMRNGQSVDEVDSAGSTTFRYTDGHDIVTDHLKQYRDGEMTRQSWSQQVPSTRDEALGKLPDEPKDSFRNLIDAEEVNEVYTTTETYEDGETTAVEDFEVTQGEAGQAGFRSLKLSLVEGQPAAWTGSRTDDVIGANGDVVGIRNREQTSIVGSDKYSTSDTTIRDNGTFRSSNELYEGGELQLGEYRSRELADRSQVGSDRLGRRFLDEAGDRPIYRNNTELVNNTDEGPESFSLEQFSIDGSSTQLGRIGKPGEDPDTAILTDPTSDTPVRAVGARGEVRVTADGHLIADGEDLGPQVDVDGLDASNFFSDAAGALDNASTQLLGRGLPPRLGGALDALNAVGNTVKLITDPGDAGENLQSLGNTTLGLSGLSALASNNLSSKLGSGLSRGFAGKLGLLGAGLNIGSGISQINDGDALGGGLTIAQGAGAGFASIATVAGATGWVPGVGWGVAAVATLGGGIKMAFEYSDQLDTYRELEF